MDRFEEIALFVAVAERGSFAAAARQLGCATSTVTRAVTALESRLGSLLLARSTRSVHPTEAGLRFLQDCRPLLAELDDLAELGSAADGPLRGALALTAPQLFGRMYLLPILRDFLGLHAEVQARLLLADAPLDLDEEGLDLALRIGDLDPGRLEYVEVARVSRVVVAAPALLARLGEPQAPAELARYPQISAAIDVDRPSWRFHAGASTLEVPLRPRLAVTSNDAALQAAVAGLGVARVMSYQVAGLLAAGQLRRLLPEFEPPALPVRLCAPAERLRSPRVNTLFHFARERLANDPALH